MRLFLLEVAARCERRGSGKLLSRYRYTITRQTGSHLRLTSTIKDTEHHVTIPAHDALRVGTLSAIVRDVAAYLEMDRDTLMEEFFGR
ncbi:MAG: type II toxin-antitoxin system HicA family toxin [Candidatus Acidiferrales bacterium]